MKFAPRTPSPFAMDDLPDGRLTADNGFCRKAIAIANDGPAVIIVGFLQQNLLARFGKASHMASVVMRPVVDWNYYLAAEFGHKTGRGWRRRFHRLFNALRCWPILLVFLVANKAETPQLTDHGISGSSIPLFTQPTGNDIVAAFFVAKPPEQFDFFDGPFGGSQFRSPFLKPDSS